MRGNIQEQAAADCYDRPHGRPRQRVLLVVLALLALQIGSLISPAYACGCGAMVPGAQSRMTVDHETAVVDWDGRREQIVMRFTVDSDAPEAAWIMPVPGRAEVELAENALFDELAEITAPVHRERSYFWPRDGDWPLGSGYTDGAAAAPLPGEAAGVGVVGREQLGDFDVARLTATDPDALRGWLTENGFQLPDGLTADLDPYVRQGWEYVAVRLAPREKGAVLRGTLDPLRLAFASDRPVYPMRLSRRAENSQALSLFVLAGHRMEPRSAIGGDEPEVTYAGKVGPYGAVGELTGRKERFLTAFEQDFPRPERINGDHELRAADSDASFRRVVYDDELLTVAGMPVWLMTLGAAVAAAATAVVLRVRSRRRNAVPLSAA
ncbi:DUF2330 domain-containing protein [Streptomyces sp. NPDC058572]|uniref:DUF2330 domain-containing protein n=1 Tax=Streptomyces sp. NPDC058572 TaxID=3346546 RepID=UPI003669EF87